MSIFKAQKVVSSLLFTLDRNRAYYVQVDKGFDLYLSDTTGSVAHKINLPSFDYALTIALRS